MFTKREVPKVLRVPKVLEVKNEEVERVFLEDKFKTK
jgi:hypothetical protein